ncbi:MAG TPA: response regulator [Candidatus Limnocylindria bacterium]|nr:response regulator [Candidatus Limnocylindria bacterium]
MPIAWLVGVVLIERRARPILIVDDDNDILAVERAVLTDEGFRVREAHNGAEALVALEAEPPAMIVLDVQMPGIDGPTFARELRTRLRHVPLVILTAAADPKREADRCNAEAFLAKPFRADELLRLVRRFST